MPTNGSNPDNLGNVRLEPAIGNLDLVPSVSQQTLFTPCVHHLTLF